MTNDPLRRVERILSTHDLSWLLDLHRNKQLDLDPSYQRRSVWTLKDRRFFMDTVFRNYPSPAIFLQKSIDDTTGTPTYHVVDGKQRITTILMFVGNQFALSPDFGDTRFDGKRWRDLDQSSEIKRILWNYRVITEELDETSFPDINDVFSRLNKNASKLSSQELRHARFDGWLIDFLETEVTLREWQVFKISTTAKGRRMIDVQNLSELAMIILRNDISGFSQDALDRLYADHDDPSSQETEFDSDAFAAEFTRIRQQLVKLETLGQVPSSKAQPFLNFYTLWAALFRHKVADADLSEFGTKYAEFMTKVAQMDDRSTDFDLGADVASESIDEELLVARYKQASTGATTDESKRRQRQEALEAALFPSA